MTLILGSASPQRRALLEEIGIIADEIYSPDIDETPRHREKPSAYVMRMACEKLCAIKQQNAVVLAADTIVCIGSRILGKPEDYEQAQAYLRMLSGRRHRVMTVVAIRHNDIMRTRQVKTMVKFKCLSDYEISHYLSTNEWQGKAGGYAIQGRAGALIPWISGSYSNVVGLPLCETANLLQSFHISASSKGK